MKKDIKNINQMQVQFNGIINSYFNSNKIPMNSIIKKVNSYLFFRVDYLKSDYQGNSVELLKTIKEPAFKNLYRESCLNHKDLSAFIENISLKKESSEIKINCSFDYSMLKNLSRKYSIINLIKKRLNQLDKFIYSSFVHGSFATKDFIENWSDLDIMLVLNSNAFKDGKSIYRIRKALYKLSPLFYEIDPLAHHYFQIITSLDLNYYPESLLPLSAFEKGLKLIGNGKLRVKNRKDHYKVTNTLLKFDSHFKERTKVLPSNVFHLKEDLSYLFLLPSLLLQNRGIYLYKKDSFERAREEFPMLDFNIIDKAAKLRKDWHTLNIIQYYPNLFWRFLPNIINRLIIYLYVFCVKKCPIKKLNTKEVKNLIREINLLFKDSLEEVLKKDEIRVQGINFL